MIKKKLSLLCLSLLIKLTLIAQLCNSTQQLNSDQESTLKKLFSDLEVKLKLENQRGVDSIHTLIKSALGQQQGLPATDEKYTILNKDTALLSLSSAIELSRKLIDKDIAIYQNLWKTAKGIKPKTNSPNSIFLRTAAEYAMGLLFIAEKETDKTRKFEYIIWASQALDSLLTMQLPNGAFPFPDLRVYNDPLFSPIINNFILSCGKDSINVLSNGWIIDDKNTGEFKFDAGIITHAYYNAYIQTKNTNYKEAVIRLANYLETLPINLNYNYNTFVIIGLTDAYALTNNTDYLNRALQNLNLGVLPGQSKNGKWLDGHNASARYHSIIIQNCTDLLEYVQQTEFDKLSAMLTNAIRNQINSTNICGASTGFRWLMNHSFYDRINTNKTLKDSAFSILGNYIQTASNNGNYLDIPTMGEYIHFLTHTLSLEYKTEDKLKVYPNPSNSYLYIDSENPIEHITIIDSYGRIVFKNSNFNKINFLNLTELQNGTYSILMEINNISYTQKLIIIK